MAKILDVNRNTEIEVDSCPIHDGTFWNCGNIRYYDPNQTLFSKVVPVAIPDIITIKQAKLILNKLGLLEKTEKIISEQPSYVKIVWDYASEFHRDDVILLTIANKLNLTSDQLDSMFIDGSEL